MLKMMFTSNLAGAAAGALGWLVAVFIRTFMKDQTFESLPYGWAGLMVGAVAASTLFVIANVHRSIEPALATLAAGITAFLLWDVREIPLTGNSDITRNTPEYYWLVITMMAATVLLLVLALRAARISSERNYR